jgi:hypothetical protein
MIVNSGSIFGRFSSSSDRIAGCSCPKRVPIDDIARPRTCCERRTLTAGRGASAVASWGDRFPMDPLALNAPALSGSKHLVASTAGRYTALFKVVLCTWGKIGEKVMRRDFACHIQLQGRKERPSFGAVSRIWLPMWSARGSTYPEGRGRVSRACGITAPSRSPFHDMGRLEYFQTAQ